MGKSLDDEFLVGRVGRVVVSKRGKDAGRSYVIVGFLGEKRLALADAVKFNVDRPKPKNPKHVAPTQHVMNEVIACVEAGKNINRGDLCRFLESVCKEPKRRGRAAYGEQGSRK